VGYAIAFGIGLACGIILMYLVGLLGLLWNLARVKGPIPLRMPDAYRLETSADDESHGGMSLPLVAERARTNTPILTPQLED
jgi:hypothetical protein